MNDWGDRWVDGALQELHGAKPPDLSARIVLALGERQRGERPGGELPRLVPPRRGVPPRVVLASAAAVLLAALLGALLGAVAARDLAPTTAPVVQVELAVHDGVVESVEAAAGGGRRSRHAAGSRAPFGLRVGNRLQSAAPCRFQVGPYGELATGPATELEVKQMSVSWKHGVVAASSLSIAVVAGVVTWRALDDSGTANAGEVVHLAAGPQGADAAALAAELDTAQRRIRQLEQQVEDLQMANARTPVAVAPAAVAAEPPPEPAAAGAVFADDRYADLLAKLDWEKMGEATHEMGPLLGELIAAMQETGEIPQELATKVGVLNMQLVGQLPALMESGLPGSGANGAYTHPLVSANILASTLDAAGLSMDAGQRDRIAGLVRQFSHETEAAMDSVQEFDLQKLALEAETKDRFYREVASLLTPEQQRVMFPDGSDGYDGASLFHSSLMLRQFAAPVRAANATEFASGVAESFGKHLGFDDHAAAQVQAIVERMAVAPELWQPADAVETSDLHMLRRGRTEAAMRHQVGMLREILRTVPMSEQQRQKLLSLKHVFVPVP